MATKSKPGSADKVVSGCLYKIRAGDMTGLLVLCDRLEEIGHPRQKQVKKLQQEWQQRVGYGWHSNYKRCRTWTMWQTVSYWHRHYQRKVLREFGWKFIEWPLEEIPKRLRKLYQGNVPLCLALFGEPRHEKP